MATKVLLRFEGSTKEKALAKLLAGIVREANRGNLIVKGNAVYETTARGQARPVIVIDGCTLSEGGSITLHIHNRHLSGLVQKAAEKFSNRWGLAELILVDDDRLEWNSFPL